MDDDRVLQDTLNPTSTASELRSRLGAIEQRMAALESQMALLRKEREEVLADLHAIVYPVVTLPPEITSEIFVRYMDNSHAQSPQLLASICRSWRAIAFATCRLWTHLSLSNRYGCAPQIDDAI
jgi:hypothetical protein